MIQFYTIIGRIIAYPDEFIEVLDEEKLLSFVKSYCSVLSY
jgi:hypothetical protein